MTPAQLCVTTLCRVNDYGKEETAPESERIGHQEGVAQQPAAPLSRKGLEAQQQRQPTVLAPVLENPQ